MDDLILNAEGAETQSPALREGAEQGKADFLRGVYIPDREPGEWHGCENRADWHDGYEAGWDATFFAKVRQRSETQQPQLNFKTKTTTHHEH